MTALSSNRGTASEFCIIMKIFFAVLLLANANQYFDLVKTSQEARKTGPPSQIANAPQVNCRPDYPMCFIETAQRLAERGEQLDLALACVRWAGAIPAVPNDAVPRESFFLTLAYVQIRRREFEQAIATLHQGSRNSSYYRRDDRYLTYLGLAYEGLGRIDEAIDTYITLAGGIRDVSAAPTERLVTLYRKRFGTLDGLTEKIETNRLNARRIFFVERELINIPAPDWSLRDLDGRQVSLSDFSQKILVLSFVSAGGDVHESVLKFLQAQYDKYKDRNIAFVCIDDMADPNPQELKTNLQRMGVTIPFLINGSSVARRYGYAEPSIVLIDQKGMIRFKNSIWHDFHPYVTEQLEFLLKSKPN